MPWSVRKTIPPVITSLCIIAAPFFLGATLLLAGVGIYRMANPGPRGGPAGLNAAWDIIAPAWPLLCATLALIGLAVIAYRLSSGQGCVSSDISQEQPGKAAPD